MAVGKNDGNGDDDRARPTLKSGVPMGESGVRWSRGYRPDFEHPERVDLPTGHHLRPIRETDVDIDYPAVIGSREHLWATFGPRVGLAAGDDDVRARPRRSRPPRARSRASTSRSTTPCSTRTNRICFGCIYVDPPERVGADADISWWVVDDELGGSLDAALDDFVPRWIAAAWPFAQPRLVGHDLSWAEWLALPEIGAAPPPGS